MVLETEICPEFRDFLKSNGVDPEVYNVDNSTPIFVRSNPRNPVKLEDLQADVGKAIVRRACIDSIFAIECGEEFKVSHLSSYQQGKLYSLDISSACAVVALDPRPGEDVLDLCCAPGPKLCYIADLQNLEGTITGVDVSTHRLHNCRALIRKYGITNVRLFCEDGTKFATPPPSRGEFKRGEFHESCLSTKEKRRKRARENHLRNLPLYEQLRKRKRLKGEERNTGDCSTARTHSFPQVQAALTTPTSPERRESKAPSQPLAEGGRLYDKVLVDAECTHDGSIKHIRKYQKGQRWTWEDFKTQVLNPERLATLQTLQRGLIKNGFDMLKPGGRLVYSTCSFIKAQNEDVVKFLLDMAPNARLVTPQIPHQIPQGHSSLPGCVRFDPKTSGTSGFFLSLIEKKKPEL